MPLLLSNPETNTTTSTMEPIVYTIKLPPTGSTSYPDILRDGTPFASIVESVNIPKCHQTDFLYQGVNHASVTLTSVWYRQSTARSSLFTIPEWFGPEEPGKYDPITPPDFMTRTDPSVINNRQT